MKKRSGKRHRRHPARTDRPWRRPAIARLRKWITRHHHSIQIHFVKGVSYQVGSGAVTVIILWWQSRH
ncbi:hypothetical protein [Streptomyces acidiscabies]|uniref:hypothetical protein n=1 Tax=Streptomyces acidiscabies TaxID=42234 RepID=UPI000966EC27|nr:hypothetical protein [Streptomyces acidiscabies]GAV38204.1 hypothetical protein Saa2_01083 [Streptomyces acidiscabies]